MTEIKNFKLFAAIILLCLGTTLLKAQEKEHDLTLNLQQGSTFKMEEQIIQHVTQEVSGMKQEMYQTYKTTYTYLVETVNDSDYIFKITYNHIYFEMNNPLTGINKYDSDKDGMNTDDPMFKNFAALTGKSFKMRVLKTGAVRNLLETDAMIEAMMGDLAITDTAEAAAKKAELNALFGGNRIITSFENSFNIYPENKVDVGDSWTKNNTVTTVFPIIVESTYTLDLAKKKKLQVSMKSTMESNPDEVVEQNDMEMSYDLKGDMTGTFELDGTTHMAKTVKINQNISGKVSMNSTMYGEMTFPMSIETEVTKTIK